MARSATGSGFAGRLLVLAAAVQCAAAIPSTTAAPGNTVSAAPTCMHSGCTWPYVYNPDYNAYNCYTITADTCTFSAETTHSLDMNINGEYLPIPGASQFIWDDPRGLTYSNSRACVWRFPPMTCYVYGIYVYNMDFGETTSNMCTCKDHLQLEYTGTTKTQQELCLNQLSSGQIGVYSSFGNFTMKFRSDDSSSANGYQIIVVHIPLGTCSQSMGNADLAKFDIVKTPPIPRCPPFSFPRVKKELLKAILNIKQKGDLMKRLAPPLPQCYCFGTCTTETKDNRIEVLGQFLPFQSYTPYLNSPDEILRNVARQAKRHGKA